ncbi:hypothetical protein AURDEDRAFT_160898 [Auricularia subglabra TFB-10046 SS5]|nr:hypothetical protein AURDEDRAFT_160898 [Auricularia subglabra TFB-10046 SS5]
MTTALPQVTRDELAATICAAFERGLECGPNHRSLSARKDSILSNMILREVHSSLSRLLRAQNARNSLYTNLPPELWCHVWSYLPFASRIAFYVTAHATDCKCAECMPEPDSSDSETPHPKGWARSPYPADSSNVSLAPIVLPRSASLPLLLTVHVIAHKEQRGVLLGLASVLEPHSHRIHALDIRASELLTARGFMEDVGSWPSLRHLTVGEETNDLAYVEEGCVVLPTDVELPELKTVQFLGNCHWPDTHWYQFYPSVQSVSIPHTDNLGREFESIFTSCEHLRALDADLAYIGTWHIGEFFVFGDVPRLASCLRSVRIRRLTADYENNILEIFELPTRPFLSLGYEGRAHIVRGREIFGDLTGSVFLCIDCRDGMLSVQGEDVIGRIRNLSVRYDNRPTPQDLISILSPKTVQALPGVASLTVDGSLWFYVVDALASFPSLVSLEVTIDNTTVPWVETYRPHFPALQTLTLLSYDGVVRLSASMIALVIRNMKLPLPIPVLNVDHRLVPGPKASTSLRNVARSVSVGVYHVKSREGADWER